MKRNYVKILLEETEKTAQAQAPEGSELGLYAFAPRRRELIGKGKPVPADEPDTPYEEELLKAIKAHVEDDVNLNPTHTANIKKFLANGWYNKTFFEPPASTTQLGIWRGQAMSIDRLKKILFGKTGDDIKIPGTEGEQDVNFVWRNPVGAGHASSWTTDPDEAGKTFSKTVYDFKRPGQSEDVEGARVLSVLMRAKPGQKFLDLSSSGVSDVYAGLYMTADIDGSYADEYECIALDSEVVVDKVKWKLTKRLPPGVDYLKHFETK